MKMSLCIKNEICPISKVYALNKHYTKKIGRIMIQKNKCIVSFSWGLTKNFGLFENSKFGDNSYDGIRRFCDEFRKIVSKVLVA